MKMILLLVNFADFTSFEAKLEQILHLFAYPYVCFYKEKTTKSVVFHNLLWFFNEYLFGKLKKRPRFITQI